MASTVFGTPVTKETVKEMSKYRNKLTISRLDMAEVAFELKNDGRKDVMAHEYIRGIRRNHPIDGIMALYYNATGGAVRVVSYTVGDGALGPSPVPMVIANGQWGAYLHNVDPKANGTNTGAHAIVFAGKNAHGVEQQWVYVMRALWPGRCFTEIRPAGYYSMASTNFGNFSAITNPIYVHQANERGCQSFAAIGNDTKSPFFEGILTIDGAYGW